MDRLGYTAMTAARRTELTMQVHANNLANVNTSGFRADLEQAEAHAVKGYGYDSRHMTIAKNSGVDMSSGELVSTGRDLDIAVQGNGLIAVGTTEGEAYTRNGNIQIDAQQRLTIGGLPVQGEGGAIELPEFDRIHIGSDGIISITPRGESRMTEVDRIKLVNVDAANIRKNEQGLLVSKDGNPLASSESVKVVSGFLESSNVSAINELVASMSLNRLFEAQVKMMKAAEDISNAGNRMIRGS